MTGRKLLDLMQKSVDFYWDECPSDCDDLETDYADDTGASYHCCADADHHCPRIIEAKKRIYGSALTAWATNGGTKPIDWNEWRDDPPSGE